MRSDELTRLSRTQLISAFESSLRENGIDILQESKNGDLHTKDLLVLLNGAQVKFHVYIKNIASSYFYWEPDSLRIQVRAFSLDELPPITNEEVFLLVGALSTESSVVFAFWNIFDFISHKTNASAYIYKGTIMDALAMGKLKTNIADHRVYVCRHDYLKETIETFIKENAITPI
jgi:hypothetical protein